MTTTPATWATFCKEVPNMSSAMNHRRRSHRSEAAHYQAMMAMPKRTSPNAFGFGFRGHGLFSAFRRKTVPKT